MNSKDTLDFLLPLSEVAASFRGVAIPGEDNSLSGTDLADVASCAGLVAQAATDVAAALAEIRANGDRPLRVLICGSLYLAGRILAGSADPAGRVKAP